MQSILRLICCISVGIMLAGCSGAPKPQDAGETPRDHYIIGMQKLDAGDLAAAKTEFDRATELDNRSAEGHTGRAFLELARDEYEDAISHADRALSRDPAFLDAAAAKGLAIASRKDGDDWLDRAVSVLRGAIAQDSTHARCLFSLGEVYFKAAEYTHAREWYDRVIALDGDFAEKARERKTLAGQLERAGPLTDRAREIALAQTVSRGDLCVLLLDCLHVVDRLAESRPMLYGSLFDADGERRATPEVRAEVSGNRWRDDILDVLVLELPSFGLYPDGRFYPDRVVTRAELAVVLQDVLALLSDDPALATRFVGTASPFRDVHPDSYSYNAVRLVTERGYLAPRSAQEFDPGAAVISIDAVLALATLGSELDD